MAQWSDVAKIHWKTYLPEYYRSLIVQNALDAAVELAENNAEAMIEHLTSDGNSITVAEAKEIAITEFILLKPEALV